MRERCGESFALRSLLSVSGVALTERTISCRRPGCAEYVERTGAFIPLPPKRREG